MTANTTKDLIAKSEQALAKPDPIAQIIDSMKGQIARAVPKHISAERLARVLLTEMRKNAGLMECMGTAEGKASLLGALMLSAQLGLEPGPLGHAYLVPFNRNAGTKDAPRYVKEVQFIIGYQGYINLARQSGELEDVYAECVYAQDNFTYKLGLQRQLEHVPNLDVDDRGPMKFVYAVARYKNGGYSFVVLTKKEVDGYRQRGKSKSFSPWDTDYEAMARKTAIRRLSKMMPLSIEFQKAVAVDETETTIDATYENAVQRGDVDVLQLAKPVEAQDDLFPVEEPKK